MRQGTNPGQLLSPVSIIMNQGRSGAVGNVQAKRAHDRRIYIMRRIVSRFQLKIISKVPTGDGRQRDDAARRNGLENTK